MSNIQKQLAADFVLPDGSVATSVSDVDRYLRQNNLAHAGDYSDEYIKNIRLKQEKARRDEFFADFVHNYKRMIWNGKQRNKRDFRTTVHSCSRNAQS